MLKLTISITMIDIYLKLPSTPQPYHLTGEKQAKEWSEHDGEHGTIQNTTAKVLDFCIEPKKRVEIQEFLDIKSRSYLSQKILRSLIKGGLLKLTIPDKPTSKIKRIIHKNDTVRVQKLC